MASSSFLTVNSEPVLPKQIGASLGPVKPVLVAFCFLVLFCFVNSTKAGVTGEEEPQLTPPEGRPSDSFCIDDGCGRAQAAVGGAISGQVVLGCMSNQAEQAS